MISKIAYYDFLYLKEKSFKRIRVFHQTKRIINTENEKQISSKMRYRTTRVST